MNLAAERPQCVLFEPGWQESTFVYFPYQFNSILQAAKSSQDACHILSINNHIIININRHPQKAFSEVDGVGLSSSPGWTRVSAAFRPPCGQDSIPVCNWDIEMVTDLVKRIVGPFVH